MSKLFLRGMIALAFIITQYVSAAAGSRYSQKFKDQSPIFYAALAAAAYKHNCKDVQKKLDKRLGYDKARVLDHCDFKNNAFGRTNIILVEDDCKRLYVAFEGSSEGRNWVGNISMAARGAVSSYAVPHGIRKKMHRLIKGWEKWRPGSTLVALIGHSQGGLFASEVACSHHTHYTKPLKDKKNGKINRAKRQGRTSVVTFNAFLPVKKENQYHFRTKQEYFASFCSPSDYYININESSKPTSLSSNHGMKYVFRGLDGKSWNDYL